MRFTLLIAFFAVFTVTSCKKERTCECSNSYSTYDAGTIEKTKVQAKKYCKSLSAGETVCTLK